MTIKELKEILETYPDDLLVVVEENAWEYRALHKSDFNAKALYSGDGYLFFPSFEPEEDADKLNVLTLNLFEYIWTGIIYGHGGDGVAKIHLQQTDAKQMAEEFYEWIKKEKGAKCFKLNSDRAVKYNVWCNQEGFIFTNEKYEPEHEFDDLVVIDW